MKVPLVSQKDPGVSGGGGDGGLGAITSAVEEDRRHFMEAALVRIMKARKTLEHSELVAEAMRQSAHRFSADAVVSKERMML